VSSISNWRSFLSATKAAWNAWALTNYSSLRNPSEAIRSGYVAFRGVMSALNGATQKYIAATFTFLPGLAPATNTNVPFDFTVQPYNLHVVSQLMDGLTGPWQLLMLGLTATHGGNIQFDLQIGLVPHLMATTHNFYDANNNPLSFSLFISTPGNSINFRPKNYLSKLIFNSGIFSLTAPYLIGSSGLRFSFNCSSNLTDSKYCLIAYKYYYFTLVALANNGTQSIITRLCVQVI
ncbi:MAG TPA: hypothetical protein VIK14_16965, partial [Ignavibacteria bacterium]